MTTRIMPVGASNTYGMSYDPFSPGGFRGPLQYMLQGVGADVNFVGRDSDGDIADPDHNGHPGKSIEWYTAPVDETIFDPHTGEPSHRIDTDGEPAIEYFLERGNMSPPDDVVLLLAGTNNVLAGDSAEAMLTKMDVLLDRIVSHGSSPEVLVMKLQPVGGDFWEDNDPSRTNNDTIGIFNEGLEQLVANRYADLGVRVVDMQATAADLSPDGIHFTEAGYRKAAAAWYEALRADDVLDFETERPSLSRTRAEDSAPWTRSEFGGDGADRLTGKAADDRLDGGAGGDTMKGRKGDDSYFVDDRDDRVVEKSGLGTDTVYTTLERYRADRNVENVTLRTAEDAVLIGNQRDNVVRGGGGEDTIKGGRGSDVLFGGGGDDAFVFRAGQADGDRVRGFQEGDVLRFKGFSEGAVLVQLENDLWSLSHEDGVEVIQVTGQSNLSEGSDYFFV